MFRKLFLLIALATAMHCSAQNTQNISGSYLFIENKGQIINTDGKPNTNVLFTTQKKGVTMVLSKTGVSYQWMKYIGLPTSNPKTNPQANANRLKDCKLQTYSMNVELVGANPNPVIEKHNAEQDEVNYYLSHCPAGITNVKHYQEVVYKNVYKGIDWVWYFKNDEIKYDFIVHPGADYKQIRLKVTGANNININAQGGLALTTPEGTVTEGAPISFVAGEQIASRFLVSANTISFDIAKYPANEKLIIDPSLVWSTYYGTSAIDYILDIALDKNGNTYTVGSSFGSAGISDSAGYQKVIAGQNDGFIAKFNADGKRQWATYYGGTSDDELISVCTDDSLNVIAGGYTNIGTGLASAGSHQYLKGGYLDAILVKLNPDGTRQWATYYGGIDYEVANAVFCDKTGNIYLAGTTTSTDSIAQNGYINTRCNTSNSAFVAMFNSAGVRAWGTYYCGSNGSTEGNALAVDAAGNVYLAGTTTDTSGIAFNGLNNTYGGGLMDGYIVKFTPGGGRIWGSYYGGARTDCINAIAIDEETNVYLTGYTTSTQNIAASGYRNNPSDTDDVFLTKLDSSGVRKWATYYGGKMIDRAYDICINKDTNIFITGTTYSDTGIALSGYKNTYTFIADGFFSMFSKNGAFMWGSYYGANDNDDCFSIATQGDGIVYIAGQSESIALGSYGHQNIKAGLVDGLLAKFFFKGFPFEPYITGAKSCDSATLMLIGRRPNGPFNVQWFIDSAATTPFYATDTLYKFLALTDTFWVSVNYKNLVSSPRYPVIGQVTYHPIARFALADTIQCLMTNSFSYRDSSTYYNPKNGYFWDFGNDSTLSGIANPIYSYDSIGIYPVKFKVTDSVGCSDSILQKVYVGIEPNAGFSINSTAQCLFSNQYEFTDSSSIDGGGTLTYMWDFGNSTTSTAVNPKLIYTTHGNFDVKLIATSMYGCKDTAIQTVNVIESPVTNFKLNADTQCYVHNNFITINNSTLPSTSPIYRWDFGDSTIDSTASPIHVYTKSGSYTITLTITDSASVCSSFLTKQVLVSPQPLVGFWNTNDSLCLLTNTFVFNDTSSMKGGSIVGYKWYLGDSTSDTARFISHKYAKAGDYTVKLVAVSNTGCPDSASKTVTVVANPHASFTLATPSVCAGGEMLFTNTSTATLSDPLLNYTWDFGDAASSTSASPSHTYLQKGTYSFNLRVSTVFGCDDDTSLFLPVYAKPVATFNVPATGCQSAPTPFTSTATVTSGTIAGTLWRFGNGDSATNAVSNYGYPSAGTFNYTFIATTNNGCKDTATGSILINPKPVPSISGPATVLQNKVYPYTTDVNSNWQYKWLTENSNIYSGATTSSAQVLFPIAGSAKVKLFVTELTNFCQSDTIEKIVSVGANGLHNVNAPQLKLYPNPVTSDLFIETETGGNYYITDVAGKHIAQGQVNMGSTNVNTTALAAGTYLLVFTNQNGNTGVYKLVKE